MPVKLLGGLCGIKLDVPQLRTSAEREQRNFHISHQEHLLLKVPTGAHPCCIQFTPCA